RGWRMTTTAATTAASSARTTTAATPTRVRRRTRWRRDTLRDYWSSGESAHTDRPWGARCDARCTRFRAHRRTTYDWHSVIASANPAAGPVGDAQHSPAHTPAVLFRGVSLPVYAYTCTACGHSFDIQQSFTDSSLTVCPECSGLLRKVFS